MSRRNPLLEVAANESGLGHAQWPELARCRGLSTNVFYPQYQERGAAQRTRELAAKRICHACPGLQACRRYAVDAQEPHGIWGATTPHEREELRSRTRHGPSAATPWRPST